MKQEYPITSLFIDIGGVLLTNGWDRYARKAAAKYFRLEFDELEERHHLTADTYEQGKMTMEEYLRRVVFYQDRPFTQAQFQQFMFDQSKPFPEMISLIIQLKEKYKLKVAVISNEARELTVFRIKSFRLNEFVDFFISSCFVHMRKPDPGIFRMALDVAQVSAGNVLYIEDRLMFVQLAEELGIRGIKHEDYHSTLEKLSHWGLTLP